MPGDLFDITVLPHTALARAAVRAARPLLRAALGLSDLERLYRRIPASPADRFATLALHALDVNVTCDRDALARVPAAGPLVVTANHPHGALDGLVLMDLLQRVRPDLRVLATHWLAAIPELAGRAFFVDPFGGPGAAERSRAGLRAAHVWLRQGGSLIVFPSGEVAPERSGRGVPVDGPWQSTVGRLVAGTGATTLPVHIDGGNSPLFYRAGRVHPVLRTLLLGRELLRTQGTSVHVRIGEAWTPAATRSALPADVTATLRRASDALADPVRLTCGRERPIADEVAALPPSSCLIASGGFRVYCTSATAIPETLKEIGRLRATTYQAIGEGTSGSCDLDAFDQDYLHLFSWDADAKRVVGAYRLGRTDDIVRRRGVGGLYTCTLFAYDRTMIDRVGPALELGRAFVRAEYQRHHSALLLLWKGICRFVAQHPEYRRLFGPVSISARYSDVSRHMLMAFLEQHHRAADLAALVTARNPPSRGPAPADIPAAVPSTADEAGAMIAALEADGKGVPVLLRQYLKLNAEVLAFNVDPDFGHALDALMVVDLTRVERPILARYFAPDDLTRFLSLHTRSAQAA